jgi:hypothetical protein
MQAVSDLLESADFTSVSKLVDSIAGSLGDITQQTKIYDDVLSFLCRDSQWKSQDVVSILSAMQNKFDVSVCCVISLGYTMERAISHENDNKLVGLLTYVLPLLTHDNDFTHDEIIKWVGLACNFGRVDVVRYLVGYFGLSKEDLHDTSIFEHACNYGSVGIWGWLISNCGFTKKDAVSYRIQLGGELSKRKFRDRLTFMTTHLEMSFDDWQWETEICRWFNEDEASYIWMFRKDLFIYLIWTYDLTELCSRLLCNVVARNDLSKLTFLVDHGSLTQKAYEQALDCYNETSSLPPRPSGQLLDCMRSHLTRQLICCEYDHGQVVMKLSVQ